MSFQGIFGKSLFNLVHGLFLLGALFPNGNAYADYKSDRRELQLQLNDVKKEIKSDQDRIKENKRLIAQLQADSGTMAGYNGDCTKPCSVLYGSPCTADVFKKLGFTNNEWQLSDSSSQEGCKLLYDADPTLTRVPSSCAGAIKRCGSVAKNFRIKELENQNKDLTNHIKTLKEDQKDFAKQMADLRGECPDCELASILKPREPKLGDYISSAIPWLTQLGLGGMSLGMGIHSMNSYNNNYSAYMNQCRTVGVPCGQPLYMMGGMGMGMGMGMMGMGGMGMPMMGMGMGIGMGMPMMGMGGMGMPMMGTGMGLGIGLGVGGLPMMGMGGMGMPMMGMGMPMMGTGMGVGLGVGGLPMMGMGMPMMGMGMPMMGTGMGIGLGVGGLPMMGMGMPMMGTGMGAGLGVGGFPMMGMGMPMMGMGMPMMGTGMGVGLGIGGMGMPMGMGGMGMPMMGMGGMGMGMPGGWMNPYGYSPGSPLSQGWGVPSYQAGFGPGGGYGPGSSFFPYGSNSQYMNPYMTLGMNNPQYNSMYGASMMNAYNPARYAQQDQTNFMIANQTLMEAQQRVNSFSSGYGGGGYPGMMPPMGRGGYPFGF